MTEHALFEHVMQILKTQASRLDAQNEEIRRLREDLAEMRTRTDRMRGLFELATSPDPRKSSNA